MFINRHSIRGWLLVSILLLNGCNGDTDTNNDNSVGKDSSAVSLLAENVMLPSITNNRAQVNLKDKIHVQSDEEQSSEVDNYVANVESIDERKECSEIQINSTGFFVDVGDFVGVCSYKYDAANRSYPDASAQAYSIVVSQKDVNGPVATFKPISRTTMVNLPVTIDLGEELDGMVPSGYKLSQEVSLFGFGSVEVDTDNEAITYIPTSESEAGFTRIIYSYDNESSVIVGNITISLSEEANSAPNAPNIDYSEFGKPQINVNEEVVIDLSSYVSDPDGDAIQLIDVNSWNAAVTPVVPHDMNNLEFSFYSTTVGEHIVSYVLSDHFGGYASGLVRIEVYDPKKAPPWGNIKMDDKLFWGPLSKAEADAQGIDFTGTHYEKDTTIAISVFSQAEKQCQSLGRLPTAEEMRQLSQIHASDVSGYNWPLELGYYAKDGSEVKIIDIVNGNDTAANVNGQYVTCVTEGGFIIDSSESVLSAVADGREEAKVVAKVSAGGKPIAGVTVFANVDGDATLKNSEAQTNEDGFAKFGLVSKSAGHVDVTLSMKHMDTSPKATVQFLADERTANLKLNTTIDEQSADGGVDEVVASVVDVNNNPIPNLPIEFSSKDTVEIRSSSVQTGTDGKMRAEVVWTGKVPEDDVQAIVQGAYTTSLDTLISDRTDVHFKGVSYEVVNAYQKMQGTIDRPAVVCALITKNGKEASDVKVQWTSKESWVTPLASETTSNGLGEACTLFNLLDSAHHDEFVEVTAAVASSLATTKINFVENTVPLISVKLSEAGTDSSPAIVVAHVNDQDAVPVQDEPSLGVRQ